MSRESTPVAQGKTFYGPSQTIPDSDAYTADSLILEGQEGLFKHVDPTTKAVLSNRTVKRRLMRNTSGITVYACMGVIEEAGYEGKRFDGYAGAGGTGQPVSGVIDQHLGSTGCRNGDLCWVTFEGPTLAYAANQTGGFVGNDMSVGDYLHAMSAAASTANTAGGTSADDGGKFTNWAGLTSTSNDLTDGDNNRLLLNVFAKAMSAATSGQTNTLRLIDVLI